MGESIRVHRYTLRSAQALNRASNRTEHSGALLQIGSGYGCIHPWPELGDVPLDTQLEILAAGGSTPLLEQAKRCAAIDGTARERGENLFASAPDQPRNHWLYLPDDNWEQIQANGFSIVKLKIGPDGSALTRQTSQIRTAVQHGLRIRLDSNDTLDYQTVLQWWHSLSNEEKQAIQLIEDPCPWDISHWQNLRDAGVPIAADRDAAIRLCAADWQVCKPAISEPLPHATDKTIYTSYMDHSLGLLWAAYRAAVDGVATECGLLTHRCYESSAFSECLGVCDTRLIPPTDGTGLGMDKLLENLPWQEMTK